MACMDFGFGRWVLGVGIWCLGGFPVLAFVLALLGSLVLEFMGYCIGRCAALGLCDCCRAFG